METVKLMEPTFGGINLEDIAAPNCFEIEERLKKETNIPIFHDDQHGTAIVKLLIEYGVREIIMCDSKGAIYEGRPVGMNAIKDQMAKVTNHNKISGNLNEIIGGADVFIGVSVAGGLTAENVKRMNPDPIIFAMANPTPEIMLDEAKNAGALVIGTGRSDFPNQVNNVLAFPGIFRGALDVSATQINEEMKMAASVAKAAMESGVARLNVDPELVKSRTMQLTLVGK